MKKATCYAAVIAAIVCLSPERTASCVEETSTELPPITNLVPADGTEVDVMGFPERFMELSRKLQAGLKANPGAFASSVLNAKPGEPFDYDPRLGMTEEEYREFLELAKELKFVKLGSVAVKVSSTDDGVKLDGGEFLPELSKLTFILNEKQVRTPFGKCTKVVEVRTGDGQKAMGAWDGLQWTHRTLLPLTDVTVSLGKLRASGRGLLIYRAKGLEGSKPKSVTYALTYDLPAAK